MTPAKQGSGDDERTPAMSGFRAAFATHDGDTFKWDLAYRQSWVSDL